MTDPGARHALRAVLFATALFFLVPGGARGAVQGLRAGESAATAGEEGWRPWPLVHWKQDEEASLRAVHPFHARHRDAVTGDVTSNLVWPFWTWSRREQTPTWRNRESTMLFPFWQSVTGEKNGVEKRYRYFVPFFWQGETRNPESGMVEGEYLILAPFLWKSENAVLTFPLFPRRPQDFFAIWPLFGEFRGFWNRDLIEFVAWPLFVRSTRGEGAEKLVQTSVPWPFVSWIRGADGTWGHRFWPLAAHVKAGDGSTRAYWLWPLGHHRREMTEAGPREVDLFLPFYGRIRDPEYRYDMAFPVYGRLDMKGRRVRGWALALYNEDDNLRQGVRNHRLLWFVVRWTSDIAVPEEFADSRREPLRGGGVFPFYVRRHNSRTEQLTAPWPIHAHRRTEYEDRTLDRRYVMPFYLRQTTEWSTGERDRQLAVFPFYRSLEGLDGSSYENAPHLFPYTTAAGADRNWAPLWTAWSRERTAQGRQTRTRMLGGVWQEDANWLGVERRKVDLGFVQWERWKGAERPAEKRVRWLWGMASYERLGDSGGWRLFGKDL